MNILQRIHLSVFPDLQETKHQQHGQRKYYRSFLLHFRPASVAERTLKTSLTWGLGGIAAALVFLLFGSGLMLKFAYDPTPGRAYESIVYLNSQVPFGQLLRNIHHCLVKKT